MDKYHPSTEQLFRRNITTAIHEALADTPVVLVHGPRQSGKSTLVRSLRSSDWPAVYHNLDDLGALASALERPDSFVGSGSPMIIDEAHRAPDLFRAIKLEVDRDRRPGRFLLTGSADYLLLPRISESLAGRIEIFTLWPLSQGEIEGFREGFVDSIFGDTFPVVRSEPLSRSEILQRAARGGFPEIVRRSRASRRRSWFASYLTTVVERDIRDIANIDSRADLARLIGLVAARSSSPLNLSGLSRDSGIPYTTLRRYLALLETTFLVHPIPAWSGNFAKKLIKSPKLYMTDTGSMAHLLGRDEEAFEDPAAPTGPLLETFVAIEILKQIGWSETRPRLHHFRSTAREEIDIVLEDGRGRIVGIEVKASGSPSDADFRHLRTLRSATGSRFVRGIVLYPGTETLPFGSALWAVPIPSIWRTTLP